ncbi:hypothetical protein [Aquibacillus salsiterrae]|uniref:Uncharacterized protein n=1 Tax=Aquibacillus salsiterrae TaxID=2950439 RepID=A0A9X3WK02_9BACI|nr:hypothetical protein [Aquibacillus salsiterrae]MDC3418486.1 hypothetical protein [Aquibacillus salsiterrae]
MVKQVVVLRKIISGILSSAILSLLLVFIHGYTSFIIYFVYFSLGTLVIGLPISIITDLVIFKIKGALKYLFIGLILHLVFASFIVYLFSFAESGNFLTYSNDLVYSIFAAAVVLWVVEGILKKIGSDENK